MHENPLVMAYMGDTIYEQHIREFLIRSGVCKIGDLQKKSLDYVSAKSQRRHLERLETANFLTDEEIDIVKWGRNAKGAKTKNADIVTYRLATGFEALIGKLYFDGKLERIKEIMDFIVGEE
ncbi:MAG: Mini-ribonuclease 3 [Bacilli bacterium]|nr:Mini-ribonuclease 3 [Bacilli bacterium]